MSTFCFFNIKKIYDEQAMDTYRSRVLETVSQYQGKYIVSGGPYELKEGNWPPSYPIMIEFPTQELANAWYHSRDYDPLKHLRIASVDADAVFFHESEIFTPQIHTTMKKLTIILSAAIVMSVCNKISNIQYHLWGCNHTIM